MAKSLRLSVAKRDKPSEISSLFQETRRNGAAVTTLGVVTSFGTVDVTIGSGDVKQSFVLIDPSYSFEENGVRVILWSNPNQDFLLPPVAKTGDVLYLRRVKYQSLNGHPLLVGYKGKSGLDYVWVMLSVPSPTSSETIFVESEKGAVNAEELESMRQLAEWYVKRKIPNKYIQLQTSEGVREKLLGPLDKKAVTLRTKQAGEKVRLIRDIGNGDYFDSICKVVKIFYLNDDRPCEIFITDYTSNSNLHEWEMGRDDWAGPYGKLVLQVTLYDENIKAVNTLQDQGYYHIKNIRVKYNKGGKLEGQLNGDRSRGLKARWTPISPESDWLHELQRRERVYNENFDKEVRNRLELSSSLPQPSGSYTSDPTSKQNKFYDPQLSNIKNVSSRSAIQSISDDVEEINGSVVDYFPNYLCDFVTNYCEDCQLEFSIRSLTCPSCKTRDAKRAYKFFLFIENEGTQIPVAVTGDEATKFLHGLQPVDIYRNSEDLLKLRRMLRPVIGNIDKVKEGFQEGPPHINPPITVKVKSISANTFWLFDSII